MLEQKISIRELENAFSIRKKADAQEALQDAQSSNSEIDVQVTIQLLNELQSKVMRKGCVFGMLLVLEALRDCIGENPHQLVENYHDRVIERLALMGGRGAPQKDQA